MRGSKSLSEVHESVSVPEKKSFMRTLLAFIGPAYLISVGYMDPGNWATDIAGGSKFGYSLIWVLLMSNLMALLLQSLAARLGIVKGLDLAQASRHQYPRAVNASLYVLAEIAIAACDLAEIIGMAIGLNLLFGLPLLWGVAVTVFDTFLLLFLLNRGVRKMEAFILVLVFIIGISFLLQMLIVKPDGGEIMQGFVPTPLSGEALYIAIGIIGATVMPHNLYLHSALVQTRKFNKDEQGTRKAIRFNVIDSAVALNLAFFVNAAILILAASAFHNNSFHNVADIQHAHKLLNDIFGSMAPALFAIALIAAGQSSTITGTLAGQIVMEGYLNLRISPWLRRIATRVIAIVPAVFTILYFGENRLGDLLILSQVILSLQLGFAIIPLIHFTGSERLMGSFVISKPVKLIAWIVALLIVTLNVKLVYEELLGFFGHMGEGAGILKIGVSAVVLYCAGLLLYIIFEPLVSKRKSEAFKAPHGKAVELGRLASLRYRYIGLTVDFSEHDKKTINHALALGGTHAQYLLVHVVESAGAMKMGSDIMDRESQFDLENLQAYQEELQKRGYTVMIKLGFGKPARVISEIINQSPADILVMGAHGHKGIMDFIFGTTLDKVRHEIKIPVFIVK